MHRAIPILAAVLTLALAGITPAVAEHRYDRGLEHLQLLAHEVHEAAAVVHHRAEAAEHHYDAEEQFAFRKLHQLERRARRFHQAVEGYRAGRVDAEYRELVTGFYGAADALPLLHADRGMERDFARLSARMDRLIRTYEDGYGSGRRGPYGYGNGHGGYRQGDRGRGRYAYPRGRDRDWDDDDWDDDRDDRRRRH